MNRFILTGTVYFCQDNFNSPNPDIETKPFFPSGHCEQLKGACLHAEVLGQGMLQVRDSTRRRGNLVEKDEIASLPADRQGFPRNDNS
jgi:hypothetical protein